MNHRLVGFAIAVVIAFSPALVLAQPAAMPKAETATETKVHTGTVVETLNAAGYTYLLVAVGSQQTWVAIPETTVKTGTEVSYYAGMTMNNFTSKTLNKTFDSIIFSAGLAPGPGATAGPSGQDDSFTATLTAEQKNVAADPAMTESGGSSVAVAPLQEISVPKATGENGYTVEEIFAKAKELNGKKIRVQGKVVKFSPNIMGKNWLHLQDGTGNPLQNSHDLVITTSETIAVDSIVTMEGVLMVDKDFGAGYKYAAIIEQASLSK
jgi:hypothetical protein